MDENGYMPSEEEKNLEKLKQKIIEVNDACLKLQSCKGNRDASEKLQS